MRQDLFIKGLISSASVFLTFAAIQFLFIGSQHQNALRDEQAIRVILSAESNIVNPYSLARSLGDLSNTGFIRCVRLAQQGGIKFMDESYKGGCRPQSWLLQGEQRQLSIRSVNGLTWTVSFVTSNSPTFFFAVWAIRLVALLTISLVLLWLFSFKQRMEKLRDYEKLRAETLEQAAAQTVHDLGSPLSLLKILSVKRQLSSDEVDLLRQATQRSEEIIHDLAKSSEDKRLTNGSKTFNLRSCLLALLKEKEAEHSIPIELKWLHDEDVQVRGEQLEFARLISNLINNSVEAGSPSIIIRTKKSESSFILELVDCGTGIPNELRDRLFVRGHTSKASGKGLGLFHAKEFLRQIGGSISFSANNPTGTIFYLNIPIA